MGDPTDFAGDNGYSDVFGAMSEGWMGDGYYMGIVSSMFYVAPATDELGYTNSVYRWLGENLIRPLVGDETLANATDAQLLVGTAIFATVAVVGVYFAPAIIANLPAALAAAPGAIAAAPLAFGQAILVGAALGAAYSVATQIDGGTSWSEIDWSQVGVSA